MGSPSAAPAAPNALAYVIAQRAGRNAIGVADEPTVLPAGSDGTNQVVLRVGAPREANGAAIAADGYNLKPGEPGYDEAIAINSRTLRRIAGTDQVIVVDEPQIRLNEGKEPAAAVVEATPTAQSAPVRQGQRTVIVSYGPSADRLVLTVEDPALDEALLSEKVSRSAVREMMPFLRLLTNVKDLSARGWEDDVPEKPAPSSEPPKPRRTRA